nr:protein ACCELERATED CELL DEATH 6-like [Ipomoea batatas]
MFGISGWKGVYIDYIVARFKREHLVFNKLHQTTLDMHHVASQHEVYSSAFMHVYGGIPQRSSRRSGPRADLLQIQEDTIQEDTDNNIDKEINGYLRIGKTMTLVATLILTISFAAGFTVPGGYDSDKGYPILLRNKAFKHFVMLDTVAFTSSVSAIFIYMIMVWLTLWFSTRKRAIVEALCLLNFVMTFLALIAVVVAFLSGMYAILAPFNCLAVGMTSISSHFFLLYFFIFLNMKNSTTNSFSLCLTLIFSFPSYLLGNELLHLAMPCHER